MCEHSITSPWAARQRYRLFREAGMDTVTADMRGNIVTDLEFACERAGSMRSGPR